MTHQTNEKAPGAINTEGLTTDTTNDLNFATGARPGKAIATQVAELAIRGHAVHPLKDGGFLVCKYGYCYAANDFADLQAFARRLGVSQ
ncbi:MAG: hypothetical protein H3C29_08845 [Simplicispira suum]|uniref:hypothetical protein n=1 Tax=Simplicispira suum TaxID=2109915 RepID=UPI001C6ACA1A|nr:hypothetical protein [Simplicispira suum]MBW7833310.1 hypothetical protein [Simplicispira suum]